MQTEKKLNRCIVLDTETTGLEHSQGHRIIEVGCVEMINRRVTGNDFHFYINPQRPVDEGAMAVHGITDEFLLDKPLWNEVSKRFLEYVRGAEVVIHNAPFDVGFINSELRREDPALGEFTDYCSVVDSLAMARRARPGQRNTLDALCRVYGIDNSHRELHGALLDARILADVYLMMTGGQTALVLGEDNDKQGEGESSVIEMLDRMPGSLRVIRASDVEMEAHRSALAKLSKSGGQPMIFERGAGEAPADAS